MSRRRWIVVKGNLVEVDPAMPSAPRARDRIVGDRHYDGLRATDGADIGTRTKHREYMRLNGLTTMDDFKDTWTREMKLREERPARDPTRVETIADAVYNRIPLVKPRGREGDPL